MRRPRLVLHRARVLHDDDLVLISDLDEIPNLKELNVSKIGNNIVIFEQKMFYYKLNLFYKDYTWLGTKAVKRKKFLSPQWLRNIKGKKYRVPSRKGNSRRGGSSDEVSRGQYWNLGETVEFGVPELEIASLSDLYTFQHKNINIPCQIQFFSAS